MSDTKDSKLRGAIYGLCIGDALAMPVHWYYNRLALNEDYGWVTNYQTPRNPHPDSIFWRSKYVAANSKGEIPELYFKNKNEFVQNDNTPLGWSHALYLVATCL